MITHGFLGADEFLRKIAFDLALISEAIAVAIIAVAIAAAVWETLREGPKPANMRRFAEIRVHFGRWLTLALEFLLAADIVRTAVAPSWNDIGKLAAIAVIRTGLNFFLQRDMEVHQAGEPPSGSHARARRPEAGAPSGVEPEPPGG